jgi:hypothetical protein
MQVLKRFLHEPCRLGMIVYIREIVENLLEPRRPVVIHSTFLLVHKRLTTLAF